MSDLSDQEILKRVAVVEGHDKNNIDWWQDDYVHLVYDDPKKGRWSEEWNPLTNPADTFALIEKYHIYLERDYYDKCEHEREDSGLWAAALPGGVLIHNESLPHAICLAIIERNDMAALRKRP